MVDAETFEEELEDVMEGTMTLEYIDEILEAREVYHTDMMTMELREQEPVEGLMVRDIVPKKYHEYLHVFEAKDNWGLPPH
jgi:Asp-tRNA(Asn)/Glu-tRNA(Gln) amidotransferase C subunit